MVAEEVIAGAEAMRPIAAVLLAVAAAARSIRLQPVEERVPAHLTLQDRITAHRMPAARAQVRPGQLHRMHPQAMQPRLTAAVKRLMAAAAAILPVAAVDMQAAESPEQAAARICAAHDRPILKNACAAVNPS
jgi:hypothetical protein